MRDWLERLAWGQPAVLDCGRDAYQDTIEMRSRIAREVFRTMSLHDETFRLLGVMPSKSPSAMNELDEAERRLGVSMPASVRDWYERDSAIRILAEHSNDDPPIKVPDFALTTWHSKTLLPIRNENQGVCTWGVELDGSDDPPVRVDVDMDGREWWLQAPSFSKYVFSCVWDYVKVFQQSAVVAAQNDELSQTAIHKLGTLFEAELTTHSWPGHTQYRFHRKDHSVLIWDSEGQADWYVAAANLASLQDALESVWKVDSVGESLYGLDDVGREALEQFRQRERLRS